jgi:hypothetical protein
MRESRRLTVRGQYGCFRRRLGGFVPCAVTLSTGIIGLPERDGALRRAQLWPSHPQCPLAANTTAEPPTCAIRHVCLFGA